MRALLLFLLILVSGCDGPEFHFVTHTPEPPSDRPVPRKFKNYVTSDTCRACHPQKYESWADSYHNTMTQEVGPDTVVATWEGELQLRDQRYVLERRGDEFWIELPDPDFSGSIEGPTPRVWREVVLSTGSHHFQAYWFVSGASRKLSLFLMCYRIDEERWMPVDSAFIAPPSVHRKTGKGRWNRECMDCHTTRPQPGVEDKVHMDSFVAEFGIACEACHGPASEHVAINKSPVERYKRHLGAEAEPTIYDPTDVPAPMGIQVCGQCHGMLSPSSERLKEKARTKGLPYRPGENLFAKRNLVAEGEHYFWDDGEVRVSGREFNALMNSPCFIEGEGDMQMDCFSCHQLHHGDDDPRPREEWKDDQLKPGMRTNQACTQCHEDYRDPETLVQHTHHPLESVGSSCMNCHMPNTCWALLKASRSHDITTPNAKMSVDVGRPNACNLCHLDRTLSWAADQLEEWYQLPPPDMNAAQRDVAAGVLWGLTGDAGQRALIAWHMGWGPTQEASGTDWMGPYLKQFLEDPYDAVRFAAYRSARTLPEYEDLEYDFVGPPQERSERAAEVLASWPGLEEDTLDSERAAHLLVRPDGTLRQGMFQRLLEFRDQSPVVLAE